MREPTLALALLAALSAAALVARDAHACGGGYFPPPAEKETAAASHRVVVSISPKQTVLWDQIQYTGKPTDFAWVYPIKPGSVLEVGNDAWLEALDGGTTPQVMAPDPHCPVSHAGCGCGAVASGGGGGGDRSAVQVTHAGTVGPYATVTLHTSVPNVLADWLTQNGYAIPAGAGPILDGYVAAGYDFVAARLKPDQDIAAMQPLRVVTPGMVTTFPLKMFAVGAKGAVGVEVFVVTEGRLDVQGSPGAVIDAKKLVWDFNTSTSNYAAVRTAALATHGGRTWLTTFAQQGALFTQPDASPPITTSDGASAATMVEAYFQQAGVDGADVSACNPQGARDAGRTKDLVVDTCAGGAGGGGGAGAGGAGGAGGAAPCPAPMSGNVAASTFACGALDDLAVALVGLHPSDVWVTRLEAQLPVATLTQDLTFTPSVAGPVSNALAATGLANSPCPGATADARAPSGTTSLAAFAVGFASVVSRRRRRQPR